MAAIAPVLLAGGSGTRLWPLSRKSYPKQFSNLMGERSLFQASAERLTSSDLLQFETQITLTNNDFRFIVVEQLQAAGIDPGPILIEPEGKNTAPAILAAALFALRKDPEVVLLVAPSDHVIPDTAAFHSAIAEGLTAVGDGRIVTFGIVPTRPETGYGYLELDAATAQGAVHLKRFVEKPDLATAQDMVKADTFLWNAGIFLFRAADMVAAFEAHCPEMIAPVTEALDQSTEDMGFLRLAPEAWARCESISIDYAVMERSDALSAVPFRGEWSDLGGWDAVWTEQGPDDHGVVTHGAATALDCENALLRAESDGQQLVGLGLKDIVAVAMPDAVLVAHKDRAQDVKEVVSTLKGKSVRQAEVFPKDHRPWGWFETLALGDRFQVKWILVRPGEALSLQSHHHRSEHWILVAGTATVTVDDDVRLLTEGQSAYIPLGAVHRLENSGKVPMVLIEVQIGVYLGEDDIVRYEDVYSRS